MTLIELINRCREDLTDESVGVRRSWEDMFRYTLRHYNQQGTLDEFDPAALAAFMTAAGMNQTIVEGYEKRWHAVLARYRDC